MESRNKKKGSQPEIKDPQPETQASSSSASDPAASISSSEAKLEAKADELHQDQPPEGAAALLPEEHIDLDDFIGIPEIVRSRTTGNAPVSLSQEWKDEPSFKVVFAGAYDDSDEKKQQAKTVLASNQSNSGIRLMIEFPSDGDKKNARKYNQPILIRKENKYYIYGCLGDDRDHWVLSLLPEDINSQEQANLQQLFYSYSAEPCYVTNERINDHLRMTLNRGHYQGNSTPDFPARGTGPGTSLLVNKLRENVNVRLMTTMPTKEDEKAAKRKEEPILIKIGEQYLIYGMIGGNWVTSLISPEDLSNPEKTNLTQLFSSYNADISWVRSKDINHLLRKTLRRGHRQGHSTKPTIRHASSTKRYSNTDQAFSEQPFVRVEMTEISGQKQFRTSEELGRLYGNAEAVVFVIDCTVPFDKQAAYLGELISLIRKSRLSKKPIMPFLVINKIDVDSASRFLNADNIQVLKGMLEMQFGSIPADQVVEVSALKGTNIAEFDECIQRKIFEALNNKKKKRHSLTEPRETSDDMGVDSPGDEKKEVVVNISDQYLEKIHEIFTYSLARLQRKGASERPVFLNEATNANGRKFETYLSSAKAAILADFQSGKITDVGAVRLSQHIETLVPFVAEGELTIEQVKNFYKNEDIQAAISCSSACGQAISGLMSAALGIAVEQLKVTYELEHVNRTYEDQINFYFAQFAARLPKDSPVFQQPTTKASGEQYAKYLELARKRILNDLRKKRITPDEAIELTFASGSLTPYVADRSVTIQDVENCFNNPALQAVIKRVPMYKKILGGLIGAVLGVCIGVTVGAIIGAWSGPGAAVSALALGAYGATLGASIGAGSGLLIGGPLGAYLSKRYSLWKHPLASMKKEAMKVAKQNEEKPSRKSPTPKASQDDSSQ